MIISRSGMRPYIYFSFHIFFFFCIAFNSLTDREKRTTYYPLSPRHTKPIRAGWAPNMEEFFQPTLRRREGQPQISEKDRCQSQPHSWRRRTAPALENLQGQTLLRPATLAACYPHTSSEDYSQLAPTGPLRAHSCDSPGTCGLAPTTEKFGPSSFLFGFLFKFSLFKLLLLHCK